MRASGFLARAVGLLNHARLDEGDALWLPGTGAIHTRGMLFPIDVVFFDAGGVILGIEAACGPGRVVRGPSGAKGTLELAAGAAARHGFAEGMRVIFSPVRDD